MIFRFIRRSDSQAKLTLQAKIISTNNFFNFPLIFPLNTFVFMNDFNKISLVGQKTLRSIKDGKIS